MSVHDPAHYPSGSLHLIADIEHGQRLDDLPFVENVLREAAAAAHVTVIEVSLHHFGPGLGVTGVALLAESHISIHTWPESGLVAADIFVCGKRADAHAALAVMVERFGGKLRFVKEVPRLGANAPAG